MTAPKPAATPDEVKAAVRGLTPGAVELELADAIGRQRMDCHDAADLALIVLHARAERMEREAGILRQLYDAKMPLHERRKFPVPVADESPDVLRTLGHWPECACVECYAIHLLDEAMSRATAAEARVRALHRTLRKVGMRPSIPHQYDGACFICDMVWESTEDERHFDGCLAAENKP